MRLKKEGKIKKKNDFDDDDDDDEVGKLKTSEEVTLEKLRRQRKSLSDSAASDEYADKIKSTLGKRSKLYKDVTASESESSAAREGRLGSLAESEDGGGGAKSKPEEINILSRNVEADSRYRDDGDDGEDISDADLVDLVAKKLAEKKERDAALKAEEQDAKKNSGNAYQDDPTAKALKYKQQVDKQKDAQKSSSPLSKTTTGVGGTWEKGNADETEKTYKPSRGSWGAFPRPKNISKAYGGGKKINPQEMDKTLREAGIDATKEKLRAYREKVGIEVQSEKDHASEIEEALTIAGLAMQRGVYATAVSALEKVTKWCSTNSQVGGKVFLELAMAYEAVGRTQEAITVYGTLSNSRIEEIKFNAKRLLYGIEAMNFMRDDLKSSDFSRKKTRQTFIDSTGFGNIADNFDKVYNTAYIDLDRGGGFYRRLTESVVRSTREARQILLKATGSGEVERLKVVQALRSMSRGFDDALREEIQNSVEEQEPVAMMDGKPIVQRKKATDEDLSGVLEGMDRFVLASPTQMLENLNGEWRLQLMADKKGDGVNYYNTSISWQAVDTESMQFSSSAPARFLTVTQVGGLEFDKEKRIISRTEVSQKGGGGMFSAFVLGAAGGAAASLTMPQQIISADSVLLITRAVGQTITSSDNVKDFFSVWRRVETGTYSGTPIS